MSAPTAASALSRARGRRTAAAAAKPNAAAAAAPTSLFKNVVRESRDRIRFTLAPTHVSYANTLRRAILTEVETVGFRADILEDGSTADVRIQKNSTPLSNEMLAHRIGLLPVHVERPLEWKPEDYSFKMDLVNEAGEPRDVFAADIQVFKNRGAEEDPLPVPSTEFFRLDPVSKQTCLLAVLKGRVGTAEPEALRFEATATVGTGRENARFSPVAQCCYAYTPDPDEDRVKEFFNRWLVSQKKVDPAELEADEGRRATLMREFNTMERARCYLVDERGEPYSYDFQVESVGVLDPVYIVGRALDRMKERLLAYVSMDRGDLPEGMRVMPADARMKGFDILFTGEDHTMGNLLQSWMDANQMDSGAITFVGYKVPHPLRDEMVLRVGVEDGQEATARAAVAAAAKACSEMFRVWSEDWSKAAAA